MCSIKFKFSIILQQRLGAGKMKKQEYFSFDQLVQVSQPLVEDSQYLNKYNQYFSHLSSKCQQICISSANNLHKYGVKYTPDSPYQSFKTSVQSSSKNSEIVILSVIWGQFSQKISIINYLHENNRTNRPNQIHYNANTTLYEKIIHDKSVMFKSQVLTTNYRSSIILSVIKEVFIAKIGSALGFGPNCHMQTFFDLFIYDNCIEFGMEKCFGFQDRSFDKQNQEQLKECLSIMHFFRIIHYDIKPGNIMFSKHFNKYVLIDFNLSDASNLQLGKKSQMSFRGTVNFCCPEMVHNFLAAKNQVKKVDPYYNDVFCLQESIKFINVEKRRIIGPVRLQYLCDIIEEDEEENAVLFIKKKMYFEEWAKVYQFFSNSIFNQKFFKILIQFLYELYLTENLQIFYHTIIPSGLKETFFTRQFEYLLRKKWMVNSDNSSMMTEKKIEYASRLEFTLVDHERSMLDFNKEETEQYLNNWEKFTASKILYFSIFLEYVSLSSNKFGVDHQDRKKAARKCISFILEKEEDHRETISSGLLDQQQNNQSLIRAIMIILEWVFAINQQGANNDHSLVPNLLLQILPFIIILDIGSLEQSLKWFEQILNILKNEQDKLCFLLSLKQLNEWSKNRIGKKGAYSRYVTNQKTNEFAILGLRNFNPNCSRQLKKITQFALRQNLGSDQSTQIKYDGSHLNLKRLVKKQQFDRYLQLCTHDNNSIQKICKLTHAELINGHLSFEHYYFNLYQRYKFIGGLEFCGNIIKIYQQNLKDKNLQRRFSIYYKNMSAFGTSKLFLAGELNKIEVYLNEVEDEDIGLSAALTERVSTLSEVLKHNRQELTFQEYYSYFKSQERIHCQLKSLLQKYYRFRVERKGMKVHECFNPKHQFDFYAYNIDRFQTIEQCRTFFKDMMLMEQFTSCCYCAFAIECFIIVCQQTWVVANYPSNSLEIFANLQEQLQQLKARIFYGQFKLQNYVYFKQVMSHMILNYAIFCTFEKEYEIKHKGLRNLYHAIKKEIKFNHASLLWIYFGNKQTNKALLQYTMRILFEYQFDQLINFLVLLARHLDKNIATSNFNMVLLCFTKFLISISFHQQLAIQQCLRKQIEIHPQIKNHLTIYFYCLAMTVQNTALQQRLYFGIAPTLANFPFGLQAFYSSAIYLHFAKKLRSQQKKQPRRQLYINNKLVKLMLMKWESKIEKGKKYPASKNIYMRLLVQKLKKIEGPISTIMDSGWRYIYSMKKIY